jgi:hypothetical protein
MYAFVIVPLVEKRLVVVACEPVALTKVKFWRVDEAVATMFAKYEVLEAMIP